MRTFSFIWTDQLREALRRATPQRGYPMSLAGADGQAVIAAVNQGIDAHLEACFVPARGDRFRWQTPAGIRGRISGPRLECRVSPPSLPVLIRRLIESGDEAAESLAASICQTLEIELTMPKYVCSYAYDIACYRDFVVEAKTEQAARRQIHRALRTGRFENVTADPCWENGPTHERVFVQGPATKFSPTTTLDELTSRKHLFSPHTHVCVRCGQHANDDAVENTPCRP